ncbi:MAG TPA: AAA family ATPase, partial [Ktedonobacterales bacterium]|nr:AAA family ATPase [Ktedonobacterales bacterium]
MNSSAQTEHFGAALRRLRVAASLTQEQLAERARVSARAISALERGVNRTPQRDTLRALIEALSLGERDRSALEATAHRGPLAHAPPEFATASEPGAFWQPGADAPPADAPPFVGRARELAAIARHLQGDGPPALLLPAEPGMGKTRLLREAATRATAAGRSVLAGGCQPRSSQDPYAPVLGAIEAALRGQPRVQLRAALAGCDWLVRLLPELADLDLLTPPLVALRPDQERRLMFRAVARFCANVGGQRGALLLLDDLQWAGRDALDLIVSLVHAAGDIRLRLILAYRSTELAPDTAIHDALANLAHARLARPLPLEPLTPLEAGELLCDLLGTSAPHDRAEDRRAEVVLRRAGGVPFFLVSCAQREVERQAGDDRLEAVPWDVARSIEQRVAALPPEARALLGAAAMAGRRVARPLLLALGGRLGQRPEESLSALDILHQARLLVAAEPEAFQFTHDLIREAVEAELGPGQRIALHRWIAQTFEAATGEPAAALLAFHWQGGAMPERAVIYLERAGAHADALHAHAEAADAYQALVRVLD